MAADAVEKEFEAWWNQSAIEGYRIEAMIAFEAGYTAGQRAEREHAAKRRKEYREEQVKLPQPKQIGWELVPLLEPQGFVTQAFIACCSCGKMIGGVGGPRSAAYCNDCAAAIRARNEE